MCHVGFHLGFDVKTFLYECNKKNLSFLTLTYHSLDIRCDWSSSKVLGVEHSPNKSLDHNRLIDPKTTLCLFSYSTFSDEKGLTMGVTIMRSPLEARVELVC
jgi:hypothetical protein